MIEATAQKEAGQKPGCEVVPVLRKPLAGKVVNEPVHYARHDSTVKAASF
jgi:hypothetical protein